MADVLRLLGLFSAVFTGLALIAASQERHRLAAAAWLPPARLRRTGSGLCTVAFGLALLRDGPVFGPILWTLGMSAGAVAVAFLFAWPGATSRWQRPGPASRSRPEPR